MEMNTSDSERIHVRISDPSHPHYPEIGYLTGKVIKLFGESMAELQLSACQHGGDACFVSKGQVSQIP